MLDVTAELIRLFKSKGINLISEDTQDSENIYPIVAYSVSDNRDTAVGDNIGYSSIAYTINVWSKNKAELVATTIKVDVTMKSVNFERTGSIEQNKGGLYRQVLTYRRLVREIY